MTWPPVDNYYYVDNHVCIIHGDCRDVLPGLPKVDLVLTDPPYNVGVDYGEHNDKMNEQEWLKWASNWFKKCREKAETLLITGQARLPYYALIEPWKWLLCWWKPAAMGRSPCGFCEWEPIALWGKGSTAGLPDVIRAPIKPSDNLAGHPCPKPLYWATGQLARFPGKKINTEGDAILENLVLDPFAGSCTTGRAAKDLNRKCVCIEISEAYCEIGANRMKQEVLPL